MLLRVFLSTILFRKNRLSQRFQVLPPALLFRRCASPGLRWRVHLRAAVYKSPPPAAAVPASFVPGAFSRFYFPTSHFPLSFTLLPLATRCSSLIHQCRSRHITKPSGDPSRLRGPLPRQAKNGSHRRRATDGNLARNGRAVDVKFLSRSRC